MSQKAKILALDDDELWLSQLPLILEDDATVDGYESIDQGLKAIETQYYDVILLDLNFSGDQRSGLDVFRRIQSLDRGADVIIISGETNPKRMVELFNAGASRYLTKPAESEEIVQAVRSVLEQRQFRNRALQLATEQSLSRGPVLIGSSNAIEKVRLEIARVAASGAKDILVQGETGTGKELVARSIAFQSDPSGRLLPIHCGAISEGLAESELFGHVKGAFTGADRDRIGAFEAAGGGFVFLDEIGEMPIQQQAKLLRVLQERKVQRVGSHEERPANFKSIAATHVNLETAVQAKQFREDLYYRIAQEKIVIPPLRDRVSDIPEIVHSILARKDSGRVTTSITNEALTLLQNYSWPGNVRQLLSVIDSLKSRCQDRVIREKDVCQVLPEVSSLFASRINKALVGRYGVQLLSNERRRFQKALIECNGNRDDAAKNLGLSRATFYRKARELGIVSARVKTIDRN